MRVFIAGVDGYLGWALAQYLAARNHIIGGMDNLARRCWVEKLGSCSAIPISIPQSRYVSMKGHFGDLCSLEQYAHNNGYDLVSQIMLEGHAFLAF